MRFGNLSWMLEHDNTAVSDRCSGRTGMESSLCPLLILDDETSLAKWPTCKRRWKASLQAQLARWGVDWRPCGLWSEPGLF
jgi:hypothetical protein